MNSKYKFQFAAGEISLDFCNTVDERPGYQRGDLRGQGEHLVALEDLSAWLLHSKLLDASQLAKALRLKQGAQFINEAKELRELLFRAYFEALVQHKISQQVVSELNSWWMKRPQMVLVAEKSGLKSITTSSPTIDRALFEIAENAINILSGTTLQRVKFCAAPECGWLFYDSSKNGSRRWCDMADCGNRAKAKRFQGKSGS